MSARMIPIVVLACLVTLAAHDAYDLWVRRNPPEDSLTRYHDYGAGVTCWHLEGTNTLACLPDLLLTKRPSPKREQAVPAIQASAHL